MPAAKRNLTFNWLQAILIVMVIDDHVSTRIGFLSSLFPYNSFYMPLFVAISGYFYRRRGIAESIGRKARRIFLPYIGWNVVGNGIAFLLQKANIAYWYRPWDLKRIAKMLFWNPLSSITGAGWFAVMLFYVSVAYILLDHLLACFDSKARDYTLLAALCAAGSAGVWFCMHRYRLEVAVVARLLFFLQFYHMGRMFSEYWEATVTRWPRERVCGACIAVNVLLICLFDSKINFFGMDAMKHFHSCMLPLATSVTGGLFWYEIASALSTHFRDNRLVNILAENTFTIMMSHLMLLNIPNLYGYFQAVRGNANYSDFDIAAFQRDAWYRYRPNVRLVAFFCGLVGSLIIIDGMKRVRAMKKQSCAESCGPLTRDHKRPRGKTL